MCLFFSAHGLAKEVIICFAWPYNRTQGYVLYDATKYFLMLFSRYTEAVKSGIFNDEIVPVELDKKLGSFTKDEEPGKHDWTSLSSLPTIWGDTIARGSSSKLADGASACLMVNETGLKK